MQDDQINIEKLKSIFASATGERTIEVTEEEYEALLNEAQKSGLEVKKMEDHFLLVLGALTIKITCDYDEDLDEDEDEED